MKSTPESLAIEYSRPCHASSLEWFASSRCCGGLSVAGNNHYTLRVIAASPTHHPFLNDGSHASLSPPWTFEWFPKAHRIIKECAAFHISGTFLRCHLLPRRTRGILVESGQNRRSSVPSPSKYLRILTDKLWQTCWSLTRHDRYINVRCCANC